MIVRTGRRSHNALSRLRMSDRASARFTPEEKPEGRKWNRKPGKKKAAKLAKKWRKRAASAWQKRTEDQMDDRPISARETGTTIENYSPGKAGVAEHIPAPKAAGYGAPR